MISSHAVRPMPRDPNAGSATRGFGNVAFPKIIRQLQHSSFEVRFKALQVAEELLAQPKTLTQCVREGICPVLVKLLQDEEDECRALAADRLRLVMRTPSSAATAAAAGVLPVLLLGTMDRNGAVRNSCYRTLLACVQHEQQRQEIVDVTVSSNNPVVRELLLQTFPGRRVEIEGGSTFLAVTYVLACAIAETHELRKTRQSLKESGCCLALPLQLLEKMAQVWCGGIRSLQCQSYGLALMCTLSDTDPILSGVECVQLLIYECMAKLQKRENQPVLETMMESTGIVPYLASLLTSPFNRQVQLAAVKLLTTICSTEHGKEAAVEAGCVVKLIGLTTTGHMELTIAATGALATITTAATGKQALLQTGEVLLFLELLDWSNLSLERNILNIIANAAENPQMRGILKEHGVIKYLDGTQFSCSGTIRKARELAVQQVAFNYRPLSNLRRT